MSNSEGYGEQLIFKNRKFFCTKALSMFSLKLSNSLSSSCECSDRISQHHHRVFTYIVVTPLGRKTKNPVNSKH